MICRLTKRIENFAGSEKIDAGRKSAASKNVMTPGFIPRTVNNQPTAEGFAPLASRGWLGQM
jgi:hypothetical protein